LQDNVTISKYLRTVTHPQPPYNFVLIDSYRYTKA